MTTPEAIEQRRLELTTSLDQIEERFKLLRSKINRMASDKAVAVRTLETLAQIDAAIMHTAGLLDSLLIKETKQAKRGKNV